MTTLRYSTSFSLGIRMLRRSIREPIYAIYGYVRFADEIVDTFHDQPQEELLKRFRADTYNALDTGFSYNPILHGFQWVANQYGIERELIDAFLDSMAMDLTQKAYKQQEFSRYVYGSAEVIGLMCLRVFCDGRGDLYNELIHPARKLGEAFQKINFLRDIESDWIERGRSYFPGITLSDFSDREKSKLINDIENDFQEALSGIRSLPSNNRLGVYLAYRYYLGLTRKIKKTPASRLAGKRIRISTPEKISLFLTAVVRTFFNLI